MKLQFLKVDCKEFLINKKNLKYTNVQMLVFSIIQQVQKSFLQKP